MTEAINMTYENNVFYCTKNGTKWISIDGEKWYGEEKRIAELENKIADIKANCDLAIEGREEKMEFVEHLHTFPKYFEKTFLAGLKAGRPQWHDLRKDSTDLPKNCKSDFLLCFRGGTHYGVGFFNGLRFICYGGDYDDVIAWCEIPTFDKE